MYKYIYICILTYVYLCIYKLMKLVRWKACKFKFKKTEGGIGGEGWRGALASKLDQLERLPLTASHLLYSANSQSVRCLQDYSISLLGLDSVCKCAQYSCYIHVGFKPKQKQGRYASPQNRLEIPIFTCKVLGWMCYSRCICYATCTLETCGM